MGRFRFFRFGDLGQHIRIAGDDPGKIHHFAQIPDLGSVQQCCDIGRRQHGSAGLERDDGHTGGSTETDGKRGPFRTLDHIFHPGDPQDVGDLMGVADGGDRSVSHRHPGKIRRREHRAFDMNVGIDEAGRQSRFTGQPIWRDPPAEPRALISRPSHGLRSWQKSASNSPL